MMKPSGAESEWLRVPGLQKGSQYREPFLFGGFFEAEFSHTEFRLLFFAQRERASSSAVAPSSTVVDSIVSND